MDDYGNTGFLVLRNFRERALFCALRSTLFAARLSAYDAHSVAEWLIVCWRILRFSGSDRELEADTWVANMAASKPASFEKWSGQ